ITQLGAVLAMRPQNMTASTAYDASSNNLDGTVTGATLLNAKVADAFVNPEKATSDDDVIATVKHSGYDSAGNLDDFVKFETIMQDVTATTEDGGYKISAMVAGTMTNTLEFDGNTGILDIAGAFTAASVVSDADVTGATVASITAANLLDKSANESISGVYTFTNIGGAIVVNDSAFVDTLKVNMLYLGAQIAGSDVFTTTAAHDTVTVSGALATDIYLITIKGTAIPTATDLLTVEAIAGMFAVHRGAAGTSGLAYNWLRIRP
ncbi:MAG: hypothetical protein ABII90_10260, partial [Bacteroidota bacterium]